MRKKIRSGKVFIVKRKNFFSDTQYNRIVTGITSMKTGENRPKLIIKTSISALEMLGLIKAYYNVNKLENEFSYSTNKANNELTIVFKQGEGGTRTWYKNDLARIIAGGQIVNYSNTSPTTGITAGGTSIKFSTVSNNPFYTSVVSGTNRAGTNLTGDNPPEDTGNTDNPPPSGGENPPPEDTGEEDNSNRNIIIIGVIVAIVLLFLFMKKK